MSERRQPLIAMISAVTLDAGGIRPQSIFIPNYAGERLVLRSTSDGTTLTLSISDDVKSAVPANPTLGATRADVTVSYLTTKVTYSVEGISYTSSAASPLELRMRLTSDLKNAYLFVGPKGPPVSDIQLSFIIIEDDDLAEPRERLEWLANDVYVERAMDRITASIVRPRDDGGGAVGPMGLATP